MEKKSRLKLLVFAGESFSLKLLQYFRDAICNPVAQESTDVNIVSCSDQSVEVSNISIKRVDIVVQNLLRKHRLDWGTRTHRYTCSQPLYPFVDQLGN